MQLLWKGLMAYVARFDIDLMFGCASLAGTDAEALALPLSYLHHFHPMPENLRGAGAARTVRRHEPHAQGRDRRRAKACAACRRCSRAMCAPAAASATAR